MVGAPSAPDAADGALPPPSYGGPGGGPTPAFADGAGGESPRAAAPPRTPARTNREPAGGARERARRGAAAARRRGPAQVAGARGDVYFARVGALPRDEVPRLTRRRGRRRGQPCCAALGPNVLSIPRMVTCARCRRGVRALRAARPVRARAPRPSPRRLRIARRGRHPAGARRRRQGRRRPGGGGKGGGVVDRGPGDGGGGAGTAGAAPAGAGGAPRRSSRGSRSSSRAACPALARLRRDRSRSSSPRRTAFVARALAGDRGWRFRLVRSSRCSSGRRARRRWTPRGPSSTPRVARGAAAAAPRPPSPRACSRRRDAAALAQGRPRRQGAPAGADLCADVPAAAARTLMTPLRHRRARRVVQRRGQRGRRGPALAVAGAAARREQPPQLLPTRPTGRARARGGFSLLEQRDRQRPPRSRGPSARAPRRRVRSLSQPILELAHGPVTTEAWGRFGAYVARRAPAAAGARTTICRRARTRSTRRRWAISRTARTRGWR